MARVILLLITVCPMVSARTSKLLYKTDRLGGTAFEYDCIDYDVPESLFFYEVQSAGVLQTIPYCIRPSYRPDDPLSAVETTRNQRRFIGNWTFEQLRLKWNLTAENALRKQGFTSLDMIEQYKLYSETLDESLSQSLTHDCEYRWFGADCQYSFDFNTWIQITLNIKDETPPENPENLRFPMGSVLEMTCYTHLTCNRGPPPACLDWREICDGKVDCANDDGIDERLCEQLETVECAPNEYRCRNGRQCIPKEFYHDDPLNPDCQDGSDEILPKLDLANTYPNECDRDPTFRCEERACEANLFPCGDGQCVKYLNLCHNHRGELLMMEYVLYKDEHTVSSCRSFPIGCATPIKVDGESGRYCGSSKLVLYAPLLGQQCASTVFKGTPAVFRPNDEMYIFYNDAEIPERKAWVIVPHDECFNDSTCYNTEIDDDERGNLWCVQQQKKMNLNYVGFYSRRDLTAAVLRLTKRCGRELSARDSNEEAAFSLETADQSMTQQNVSGSFSEYPDLPFWKFCDRRTHLYLLNSDGINHNDENECDDWPCINVYTRCDGYVNCPDGVDELNCSVIHCLENEFPCVSVASRIPECLSKTRIEDLIIDCIGAVEESSRCDGEPILIANLFSCSQSHVCTEVESVCDGMTDCPYHDDETFCGSFSLSLTMGMLYCGTHTPALYVHSRNAHCYNEYFDVNTFFSLMNVSPYPPVKFATPVEVRRRSKRVAQTQLQFSHSVPVHSTVRRSPTTSRYYCHRGITAKAAISLDKPLFERQCFCPPSYYGNRCQYQSDRVSLTLTIRVSINQRSNLIFLITLRDEKHHINSFVIHKHQPSVDCETKFNYYLLYSAPMKEKNTNYFLHIDLIKQVDLSYYGSWYLPIHHSFLPVSRIATVLRVPVERALPLKKHRCKFPCHHGQCMKYVNTERQFCWCERNWYGPSCARHESCDCSLDSLCMGSANGRPMCICPSDKIEPRCLLSNPCHDITCQNGGTCLPVFIYEENRRLPIHRCVCTDEFEGTRCEKRKSIVSLQFIGIRTYSFIIIHILSQFTVDSHLQNIIFQKLRVNSNTADIFITADLDINLVFVEFDRTYYLAVVQENYRKSLTISSVVNHQRRCPDVRDLLNATVADYHRVRRWKHYPRLCYERAGLVCFHDERLMCLCTINRFSNCFEFNFENKATCVGENPCEKQGRCFEDRPNCPSIVQCLCSECYYGSRCQFSTAGLGVSLDAMLGYDIQPKASFAAQRVSVRASAIITIVMFVVGLIGNIMSLMTFQRHQSREVGCGIYLLTLSITSLLTMLMFTLKFAFLFFIQTALITTLDFLHVNCLLMDISTQVSLSTSNWLGACVAVERSVSVLQQIRFNKRRSKQAATWVIILLIVFVTGTHLPDPLHRVLIDDESEERQWCIVRYPLSIERFNSINLLLHSVIPLAINAISAVIIIIIKARIIFAAQQQQPYLKHLYKQFQDFKHLLISPALLVSLSVPRLMLAFLPGCMKSTDNLWIYLAGYFVSFVPPLLTFPIFVLPSRLYREEFGKQVKRLFEFMCGSSA